ncbi:MAG: S-layer homology domain-containing protein, partial [Butyricicoccus sp.]|nr:S-layer homology domain-containing protein [Butyricicoccus sp.]
MKNLKKVLALVLAMALSFTMFAGAVAFDDVEIGSDYSAAISMLSDLNVISGDGKGNYNPNGTITRAEACVLIANIMNGGKADTAR